MNFYKKNRPDQPTFQVTSAQKIEMELLCGQAKVLLDKEVRDTDDKRATQLRALTTFLLESYREVYLSVISLIRAFEHLELGELDMKLSSLAVDPSVEVRQRSNDSLVDLYSHATWTRHFKYSAFMREVGICLLYTSPSPRD